MIYKLLEDTIDSTPLEVYLNLRQTHSGTIYLDACRADGSLICVVAWIADDILYTNDEPRLKHFLKLGIKLG